MRGARCEGGGGGGRGAGTGERLGNTEADELKIELRRGGEGEIRGSTRKHRVELGDPRLKRVGLGGSSCQLTVQNVGLTRQDRMRTGESGRVGVGEWQKGAWQNERMGGHGDGSLVDCWLAGWLAGGQAGWLND